MSAEIKSTCYHTKILIWKLSGRWKTLSDFISSGIREILWFQHTFLTSIRTLPTTGLSLSAYRAELQKLSKDDGLLLEMEFLRREFKQLYEWDYAQENVLELKMEDVVSNPYDQIVRALLFIEAAAENTPLRTRLLAAVASGIRDLGYLYRICP